MSLIIYDPSVIEFKQFSTELCIKIKFKKKTYGGAKQFPTLSKMWIIMGHYNHSKSVDATVMVLNNYPIIGEHVGVNNFVPQ